MKSIVLLLLVIYSVDSAFVPTTEHGLNVDEYDCGPNETHQECGHPAFCDWTCDNVDEPPYITCPPVCVRRCICDDGFIRNHNGECIDRNDCPVESDN